MKKHRGLLLVVALLLVVVVGGVATLTYSRYLTASEGASTAKVAPWKIKVNDTNVVETKQFTGSEITWTQNDYVSDGYIAPNREGTFKIKIDPTGSKVAVDYEIQIDTADMASANKNIRITSVDVDGTVITVSDGKYSGTITLDEVEANTVKNITVTFEWVNAEDNNDADTTTGTTITDIEIPVIVTAKQHI
ncbi:MAG: hypothetical protein Q4F33_03090 [Mycoplasmatota bacterium]|nr:hypothetical protein [Mycoplasmatota bacterium]